MKTSEVESPLVFVIPNKLNFKFVGLLEVVSWLVKIFYLRLNRFPKVILINSATRFRMRSLDAHLAGDPNSRVACESLAKDRHGRRCRRDYQQRESELRRYRARSGAREIGYTDSAMGFDGHTCAILTAIEQQSPDISQGVTEGEEFAQRAGRRRSRYDVRLRVR